MAQDTRDSAPNIFPEIIYDDTPAALEWLARAFGFVKGEVIEGPDGTIAHAEMHLGPGTIMPKSPMAESEFAMKSPRALGGINQCLYVAVEDPDAHYERTKAAGAEIIMEPFDTDYGARNYCARDLEGHLWSFGTYWPRTAACETGSKQPRCSIGRQASELAWAKGTLTPHRRVGGSARLPS